MGSDVLTTIAKNIIDGTLKAGDNLYLVRDSELQRLGYALPNSRKGKADDTEKGEPTTQKAQKQNANFFERQKANTSQRQKVAPSAFECTDLAIGTSAWGFCVGTFQPINMTMTKTMRRP